MEWKNLYRGLLMGAVEVIPGISGGTIALLLGIYERLIEAINGLLSKDWKKQLTFLIPLGVGMVIAIFSFAKVIEWLFEAYPGPTLFFFLGLILGVLPFLYYKADGRNTFRMKHFLFMIIGVILIMLLGLANPGEPEVMTNLTTADYLFLFIAGIIGSSGLLLPGISGSFLMLVIGVYPTVIAAVSNFRFDVIIAAGLGIAIGFVVMSRILGFVLAKYHALTFAAAIGLVFGSVFVIFPGWPASIGLWIASILMFFFGLATALILGRIEYR